MIQLGTIVDGRELSYDASLYEFRVGRNVVSYADVRSLDDHAHVSWLAPEQKDWFRRINPVDLDRCNRDALGRHGNGYEGLSPEEQVQADAKRNDSVLAGKIVDADPVLVQAVIAEMEKQGVFANAAASAGAAPMNPFAAVELPAGMEELSQLAKHEKRQMTPLEHMLMRRILKNSDKAKLKREKEEARAIESAEKELEAEEQELKKTGRIDKAQKRAARREAKKANVPVDSHGNPIRPEPDAIRPSMNQVAHEMTAEEKALVEMRERNLAKSAALGTQMTDVPGMESGGRRRRPMGNASINGRAVNADGSPKETSFTKFLDGAGKVVDVISPLIGGGRGMGGGGRGGGGGGGGGQGGGQGAGGGMGGGRGGGMGMGGGMGGF